MKIRGSVVSLSFVFPHPPEDKKQKKQKKLVYTQRLPCIYFSTYLPSGRCTVHNEFPPRRTNTRFPLPMVRNAKDEKNNIPGGTERHHSPHEKKQQQWCLVEHSKGYALYMLTRPTKTTTVLHSKNLRAVYAPTTPHRTPGKSTTAGKKTRVS